MPVVGNNPTLIPQGGAMNIIAGDSYMASESRQWEWIEVAAQMAWPTLTSATIKFLLRNRFGNALEVTGEVVTPTGTKKVAVELTNAQTEGLEAGEYTYAVVATLSGTSHKVTLSKGSAHVEKQTTE